MELILVAVDGSEAALKAVDFAAKLAAQTEAELTIITVVDEVYVGDRALKESCPTRQSMQIGLRGREISGLPRMTLRLTSRLVTMLVRVIGLKRQDCEPAPMTRDRGPALVAPTGRTSEALSLTYLVVAPLADSFVGWSVYNCASNPHIVATGLPQNRATTLCEVLNLACHRRPNLQTYTVHRKGP